MSISMYFGVSWLDPRIQINRTASEWTEVKTGPKDVSRLFTKIISNCWFTWKSNKYYTVFTTNLFAMINDQSPFAGSKCFPTESKIYLVSWAGDIWTGAFWQTKSSERNVRSSHTKEQKYSLWAWVCKDLSYCDVMYKFFAAFCIIEKKMANWVWLLYCNKTDFIFICFLFSIHIHTNIDDG